MFYARRVATSPRPNSRTSLIASGACCALLAASAVAGAIPATADPGGTGLPNGQFDIAATALAKSSPVPGRTTVTFYTGIKRSESAARDMLEAVSDPDSDSYRQFLSRKDIRRNYGADRQALKKVRKSAESFGLTLDLDATGVFAAVTGRADRMSRWLNAPLRMQKVSSGGLAAVLIHTKATHPSGLKKYVQGFVGTTSGPRSFRAPQPRPRPNRPTRASTRAPRRAACPRMSLS